MTSELVVLVLVVITAMGFDVTVTNAVIKIQDKSGVRQAEFLTAATTLCSSS